MRISRVAVFGLISLYLSTLGGSVPPGGGATHFTRSHGSVTAPRAPNPPPSPARAAVAQAEPVATGPAATGRTANSGDNDNTAREPGIVALPEEDRMDPQAIKRGINEEATRHEYRQVVSSFCLYLYDVYENEFVLCNELRDKINAADATLPNDTEKEKKAREKALRQIAYDHIERDEKASAEDKIDIFDFELFTPDVINMFLCSRTQYVKDKSTGQRRETYLGPDRYSTIRTALSSHVMRVYGKEWTRKQERDMADIMKGIKKKCAKGAQKKGIGKMEVGKRQMSFELYESLNKWLMARGDRAAVFARAYLNTTWNLVCRSDSTQSVKVGDLIRRADAHGIIFAHMKNDQEGSRTRQPRNIYANPIKCWTCPYLALFEYLSTFPDVVHDAVGNPGAMLFVGGTKKQTASARFWEVLLSVLQAHEDEVKLLGYEINDIGTHSIRKGASTYLASGTTASPNAIAITTRAGWSAGVISRYCLWERAGDEYCGRILSGLDIMTPEFACPPPDFIKLRTRGESADQHEAGKAGLERAVERCIQTAFGGRPYPNSLTYFLRVGLACAMHSYGVLKDIYPPGAAVRSLPYFRLPEFQNLRGHVKVRMPWTETGGSGTFWSQLTGIPPHTVVIARLEQNRQLIEGVSDKVIDGVSRLLDQRAYGGTLSEGRVKELFREIVEANNASLLAELGLIKQQLAVVVAAHGASTNSGSERPPTDPSLERFGGWKLVQGDWCRVPQSFSFPDGVPLRLLEAWYVGSEPLFEPPLRMLRVADVRWMTKGEDTLSDARCLVKIITDEAVRQGINIGNNPSMTQIGDMYEACKGALKIPERTPKGRKRNVAMTKWTTALRLHRGVMRAERGGSDGRRKAFAPADDEPQAQRRRTRCNGEGRINRNVRAWRDRTVVTGPMAPPPTDQIAQRPVDLRRTHGNNVLNAGLLQVAGRVPTQRDQRGMQLMDSFVDSVVGPPRPPRRGRAAATENV